MNERENFCNDGIFYEQISNCAMAFRFFFSSDSLYAKQKFSLMINVFVCAFKNRETNKRRSNKNNIEWKNGINANKILAYTASNKRAYEMFIQKNVK